MLKRTYNAVEEYLSHNTEEALDAAREMNSYDGCYDWCDTYDWDDLCVMAAEGGASAVDDLVRAAVYGETYGGQVRYNGYGNLIPGEYDDLLRDAEDYLTDIMTGLENYIDDGGYVSSISISNELQEVIDDSIEVIYKVAVTDIVYDLDGEDNPEEILKDLPEDLILKIPCEEEELSDELISDAISDETGWCVCTYNYKVLSPEE